MVDWTKVREQQGGGRVALSFERIAAAGIEIADAEGLDALTMRKVAARLGAGTMSLYHYVDTKDDVLDLMADHVHREAVHIEPSGDWRADLAEAARRSRRVALRHPWLLGYAAARAELGPHMLAMIESTLALLDRNGLPADLLLDAWTSVHSFTLGHVRQEVAQRASGHPGRPVDAGAHPLLARVVAEAGHGDPEEVFDRRLGYVLEGLAAAIRR
jgi:AcrR family transcriptional regulator